MNPGNTKSSPSGATKSVVDASSPLSAAAAATAIPIADAGAAQERMKSLADVLRHHTLQFVDADHVQELVDGIMVRLDPLWLHKSSPGFTKRAPNILRRALAYPRCIPATTLYIQLLMDALHTLLWLKLWRLFLRLALPEWMAEERWPQVMTVAALTVLTVGPVDTLIMFLLGKWIPHLQGKPLVAGVVIGLFGFIGFRLDVMIPDIPAGERFATALEASRKRRAQETLEGRDRTIRTVVA